MGCLVVVVLAELGGRDGVVVLAVDGRNVSVCSVRSDVSANLFNFFVCFFVEGNGGR